MSAITGNLFADRSRTLLSANAVTITSQNSDGANPGRNCLLIANPSATANIAVNLVGTAALNTAGSVTLGPGGTMLFDVAVPRGPISAITDTNGSPITVYEMS